MCIDLCPWLLTWRSKSPCHLPGDRDIFDCRAVTLGGSQAAPGWEPVTGRHNPDQKLGLYNSTSHSLKKGEWLNTEFMTDRDSLEIHHPASIKSRKVQYALPHTSPDASLPSDVHLYPSSYPLINW